MSTEPSFENPGPVRLHRFDPERSAAAAYPSAGGDGLPKPLTSLIGRNSDVESARAMLIDDGVRLLTLTGPGGVGKTRLALRIAEKVASAFADGVGFVSLAPVAAPDLVLSAIARELGLRDEGNRPLSESLVAHLQPLELLLVLDNFEHLLVAAPVLSNLLSVCPHVSVLVTSRSVLHLSGEHDFPVSPLRVEPTPSPITDHPSPSEAVQLFVDRARAARPDFALSAGNTSTVVEICRRLDGLPLAIELAAARLRTLSPAALLARLEHRFVLLTAGPWDVPDRLRTMRNAIAWSYDLLNEREQALFRRLSVFMGGFTLEAAEAVGCWPLAIGSEEDERRKSASRQAMSQQPMANSQLPIVLDSIAALIDHSLVRRIEQPDGESRFVMLETIREFGLEQLTESREEDAARTCHAKYFAALAEAAHGVLWSSSPGAEQADWLDQLERELDNLRAALSWALANDAEVAMRLAGDLSYFWWQRGFLREGLEWTDRVLSQDTEVLPAPRARALYAASLLAGEQGDYDRSATLAEEAVERYRALGDLDGVRRSVQILGIAAMQKGQFDRAAVLFEELLERARALDHVRAISVALALSGSVAIKRGKYNHARQLLSEALALGRQHDDRFGLAWFLFKFGQLDRIEGNSAAAISHVRGSLLLYRELGSTARASVCLLTLAVLAEETSRPEHVVLLLGAAEGHGHAESGGVLDVDPADQEHLRDRLRTLLGEEAFAAAWSAGRALSLDAAIAEAFALTEEAPVEHVVTPLAALPPPATTELTAREREVLRLLALGLSDKEIAAALNVGRRTVSSHVATVRAKLGAPSRTAAATTAVRDRLI